MAKPFLPLITFLFTISCLFFSHTHSSIDSYIYAGCSQCTYTSGSAYEYNLNALLTTLVNSATYSSYKSSTQATQGDLLAGLYQCQGDLPMPECATCVAHAVSQVGSVCGQKCGGTVQLAGCHLRYDNASFLGKQDTTLVLKKCGALTESDIARGVLDGLMKSEGSYRVSGWDGIRSTAQCSGDLSGGDCSDCVSIAIGRLKTDCRGAESGDMFLGKCYVRYSPGYAHPQEKKHDASGLERKLGEIVGIIAGIVVLILLVVVFRECQREK